MDIFDTSPINVTSNLVQEKQVEAPSSGQRIGIKRLLGFMVRTYPKLLVKLLRDERFRQANRIDDMVTKQGKPYLGYVLIVGEKSTDVL